MPKTRKTRAFTTAAVLLIGFFLTACNPNHPATWGIRTFTGTQEPGQEPAPTVGDIIRSEFAIVGADQNEQEWAVAVAVCESSSQRPRRGARWQTWRDYEAHINPAAVSRGNVGAMQINLTAHYRHRIVPMWNAYTDPSGQIPDTDPGRSVLIEALKDPVFNAKVAADIWKSRGERFRGSSGWSCARIVGVPA